MQQHCGNCYGLHTLTGRHLAVAWLAALLMQSQSPAHGSAAHTATTYHAHLHGDQAGVSAYLSMCHRAS